MRVAVLPTGRMELEAVPPALAALFPAHDFYPVPLRLGEPVPFDSFTSGRALVPGGRNGNVDKIVGQMASELVDGRRGRGGPAADLVLVLDDLETPNKHQAEVVVQVFRDATVRHLRDLRLTDPGRADRVADALRWRASFHLAVPMIEAWLFADPNGPGNAGVRADRLPPNWEKSRDPEDFLTHDPAYLADDCRACTAWRALPPHKVKDHKPAWRTEHRELHPKAFLAWLCRDPAEKKCSQYQETHEGVAALRSLDWTAALSAQQHCTYLRALVQDLAAGLDTTPAFPALGTAAALTSHLQRRAAPVLRNI